MAEYIERAVALSLVRPDMPEDEKAAVTIATAKKFIRSVLYRTPTVDVVPVVHGRWIEDESLIITCSECKRGYNLVAKYTHYCPNCGAKMDGGAK